MAHHLSSNWMNRLEYETTSCWICRVYVEFCAGDAYKLSVSVYSRHSVSLKSFFLLYLWYSLKTPVAGVLGQTLVPATRTVTNACMIGRGIAHTRTGISVQVQTNMVYRNKQSPARIAVPVSLISDQSLEVWGKTCREKRVRVSLQICTKANFSRRLSVPFENFWWLLEQEGSKYGCTLGNCQLISRDSLE